MRHAVFARHGESEYSVRGLLNGDTEVSVGLTAAGLKQARRLGRALRDVPIDLCVTTALERVRLTADEVLGERKVPRLVVPELNDPLYGPFEGLGIEEYRSWAAAAPSSETPGDGGESRLEVVERYARGFRIVLARPRSRSSSSRTRCRSPTSWAPSKVSSRAQGCPWSPTRSRTELDRRARARRLTARGWVAAPSW